MKDDDRAIQKDFDRQFELRTGLVKKDKSKYWNTNEHATSGWETASDTHVPKRRQRFTAFLVVTALGVIGLVFAVLIPLVFPGRTSVRSREAAQASSSEWIRERAESVAAFADMNEGIRATASSYMEAATVEEKLQHVRRPDVVRELMEDYYGKQPLAAREVTSFSILQRFYRADDLDDRRFFYMCLAQLSDGQREGLIVEDDAGTYRVDWETHVQYNPMSRDAFLATPSAEPQEFRVYLNYSDRYQPPYQDSGRFQSVFILFPDKISQLDAYIERSHPDKELLDRIVVGKNLPPAIVRLVVDSSAPGEVARIESVVQPQWFRPDR